MELDGISKSHTEVNCKAREVKGHKPKYNILLANKFFLAAIVRMTFSVAVYTTVVYYSVY